MNNTPEKMDPLSKSRMKIIHSLHQKKFRDRYQLFIVEGEKIVREYLEAHRGGNCMIRYLCSTEEWLDSNKDLIPDPDVNTYITDSNDFRRISSMVTSPDILAVVEMPEQAYHSSFLETGLVLAFDSIRDPGNLGTIIRIADWFGISTILCSEDSVDLFNPKVIQAAMGSTLRVKVIYQNVKEIIRDARQKGIPVYGTFVDGDVHYTEKYPDNLIVLFGNESSGIDTEFTDMVSKRVAIPSYPAGDSKAESLNLAASVAIITSEIRRQKH